VSTLTGSRVTTALNQIAVRYARALGINVRELGDALKAAREALRRGTPMPMSGRTITPVDADTDNTAPAPTDR